MANAVEQLQKHLEELNAKRVLKFIILLSALLFFTGLAGRQIYGSDEPRVAGMAREMIVYDTWVAPTLNGRSFLEKPPLYFWSDAFSMQMFGFNDFAAKLPSAISAFIGVVALFLLARSMGGTLLQAFISAFFLATSAQYWACGRKCMIDMMLAMFIILAFWTFYQLSVSVKIKHKILWFAALAFSLGGAVFSKGLVGLAIPAVSVGAWLFFRDLSNRKVSPADWLWFAAASILSFIPVSIWLYILYQNAGYDAVYTVVWTNNFGRFTGGHAEHIEPFYYYLRKLPEQLQPWTVLLPFALFYSFMKFWKGERLSDEKKYPFLYMLCWLIIPYLLLMISAGKRQVYVLPLYAAETLMIGFMMGNFFEGKIKLPGRLNREKIIYYFAVLMAVIAIAFPVVVLVGALCFKIFTHSAVLFIIAGTAFGIFSFYSLIRKNLFRVFAGFALALAVGLSALDMTLLAGVAAKRSYKPLFTYCHNLEKSENSKVVLYAPRERLSGAALFYLGHRVESGTTPEWLEAKLRDPAGKNLVVLNRKTLGELNRFNVVKSFKVKHSDLLVISGYSE